MPASVELICVDPKRVHEIWPQVAELIRSAIRRTNLSHTADIETDTLHGDGLLWIAWDGAIRAAATTSLVRTDRDKVCILTACAGTGMKAWLPLLRRIEAYLRLGRGLRLRPHLWAQRVGARAQRLPDQISHS